MHAEDENKSMIANLFLQGKPLVLNYQLMENRLKRRRLTPAQRAEYARQLHSEGGFLTVADNEKDEPLLIHFRSDNDRYTLRVATPGKFHGYFLSMENMQNTYGKEGATRNLVVLEKGNPSRFYFENVSPGIERLLNVNSAPAFNASAGGAGAEIAVATLRAIHDKIMGPTYLYKNEGNLENEGQLYFSDTFLRGEHAIWYPQAQEFAVQIRGSGILELSDIS